jgi:pimeloyl-ACP methyl ester carboxylesterase
MPLLLAYEDLGAGPPVVILHGLFGSRRNWLTIARQLAGEARVLVVDLRNHGDSPHAPSMYWNELAEDVLHVLDRANVNRALIAGHSMGGKVAMTFANLHADRIRALLVLDIAPITYPNRFAHLYTAMNRLPVASFRNRQQAEAALAADIPDAPLRQFLLHNLVRDGSGFRWRVNLAVLEREMDEICGFPDITGPSLYTGPACFLAGDRSDYMEPLHLGSIHALYPEAEIHTISNAGHWVHADQPQLVLGHFQRLIAKHVAGAN